MCSKGSRGRICPHRLAVPEKIFALLACSIFFDRCGCSASLHPPLAALGSAPPTPFPDAGKGPSGQVTASFTHSLGSVTFCDWLAETKLKINLISVVASDATFA